MAIGTIPVDPSDDAGDGGGISQEVSPAGQTTDPNSHTPVSVRLAGDLGPRYPLKSDGRPESVIHPGRERLLPDRKTDIGSYEAVVRRTSVGILLCKRKWL